MLTANDLKKEIMDDRYKSPCCRRSLLYGAIFAKGRYVNGLVQISLSSQECASFIGNFVSEFFSVVPEIYHPKSGGRRVIVEFKSNSASKYILEIEKNAEPLLRKCASCQSSFLRGVFLAAGRFSKKKKHIQLDFTIYDRSASFSQLLETLSLEPRVSKENSADTVYFRSSDQISDFFGYAGFNKVVFEIIEEKINSAAASVAQRDMNCFMRNLNRTNEAASRQIATINELSELNLLSSLPDELEETARMRLEFPDLPLSELALKMSSIMSKSGVSHRLKKIEEIGAVLLKKSKQS